MATKTVFYPTDNKDPNEVLADVTSGVLKHKEIIESKYQDSPPGWIVTYKEKVNKV